MKEAGGIEVCLVGRERTPDEAFIPEQRSYKLGSTDPAVGLGMRQVAYPCNPAKLADLDPYVLSHIGKSKPLLITSALGDTAASRAPLIREIVAGRPDDGSTTVLVVCENEPLPVYVELADELKGKLTVCGSVVDRICFHPNNRVRDRSGRRSVSAHPVGEWVIEHPDGPGCEPLAALNRSPTVTVIDKGLGGYKDRKLWTVNGLHLTLAFVARYSSAEDLRPAVATPRFQQIAKPAQRSIAAALAGKHPSLPVNPGYADDRVRAFAESPDTTARLLGKVLVREDLRPLMRRLTRRIGDPARAAHAAGASCDPFMDTVELLLAVLRDPRFYYPSGDDRRTDEDIDREVEEAFAQALADWVEIEDANDLIKRLRRTLRASRHLGEVHRQ
jgi:mannitol-1-phosphate/altronate dehydrogenase